MNITLLNVSIETKPTAKGSYQMADIAYKNNTFGGKVEGKKLMSFGAQASAFKAIAASQPGTHLEIEVQKNDQGYNDWVKAVPTPTAGAVSPGVAGSPPNVGGRTVGGSVPVRSGFVPETPEERAKRQVYIIRQSSISSAVSALSVGSKSAPTPESVISYAKKLEQYVFDNGTGFDDVPNLDSSFVQADPQIE